MRLSQGSACWRAPPGWVLGGWLACGLGFQLGTSQIPFSLIMPFEHGFMYCARVTVRYKVHCWGWKECSLTGKPAPLGLWIISLWSLIQDRDWCKSWEDGNMWSVNRKTIRYLEWCFSNGNSASHAITLKWRDVSTAF